MAFWRWGQEKRGKNTYGPSLKVKRGKEGRGEAAAIFHPPVTSPISEKNRRRGTGSKDALEDALGRRKPLIKSGEGGKIKRESAQNVVSLGSSGGGPAAPPFGIALRKKGRGRKDLFGGQLFYFSIWKFGGENSLNWWSPEAYLEIAKRGLAVGSPSRREGKSQQKRRGGGKKMIQEINL